MVRQVRSSLVAFVLAFGSLAACGDDEPARNSPDPGAAAASQSAAVVTPATDPTPPTSSATTRQQRRDWDLVSLSDDGRTLRLRVDWRSCGGEQKLIDTADVEDEVEILTSDALAGEDCDSRPEAEWESAEIDLRTPLGERELIGCRPYDGSIDCRTGERKTS